MDETKPKSKRVTRSRTTSVESVKDDIPKGKSRSKKIKNEDDEQRNRIDDYDDSASSRSSSSMRSCKVILTRENLDNFRADNHAVAHSTRGRRNSQLTEENLAVHMNTSSPARRTLRSGSTTSDVAESTLSRARSTRLASSQNTPKKDGIIARTVSTPSRRSSRLLSENEKAVDSPKSQPSKRNLRSTSLASDEISPTNSRTRSSTRLSESLSATPKTLKTKVGKIDTNTPRGVSARANKSGLLADIIQEESSETDEPEPAQKNQDKLKKRIDIADDIENAAEGKKETISEIVEMNVPEKADQQKDEIQQKEPVSDNETVSSAKKTEATIVELEQSSGEVVVLVSTSTQNSPVPKTPKNTLQERAKMIVLEPPVPMDISLIYDVDQMPEQNVEKVGDGSKTPRRDSTKVEPNESSELNLSATTKSPKVIIPTESPAQETGGLPCISSDSKSNTPKVVEEFNKEEPVQEISKNITQFKSRRTIAFQSMDVTALVHGDSGASTPQQPKNRSVRNENIQSSDLEEVEKATDSNKETKQNEKLGTPQTKVVDTVKTPKSSAKSPRKDSAKKSSPTKATTPKKMQSLNASYGDKTISLSNEIDKLICGLNTPVVDKEVDKRFNLIADDLTPNVSRVINQLIDEIAPADSTVNETMESSSVADETNDVSVLSVSSSKLNESVALQSTSPQPEQAENSASTSKTLRRSVQIMTPKQQTNSTSEKRVGTPYPHEPIEQLAEAIQLRAVKSEEQKKKEEIRSKAREDLRKLSESWNKSVKEYSMANDAPKPIDLSGLSDKGKDDDVPAKKSVPARNNWGISSGLVDSDSESEHELVPETEEEGSDDEESDENSNLIIDDEAEEVEDYNSGDSMDEEERREIDENAIKEKTIDLGSDDSDEDDSENDDYDYEDGFLIADEENEEDAEDAENAESEESSDEEVIVRRRKPKTTRIIAPSSSDESSNIIDDSNGANNDEIEVNEIVSITVRADSVVVLEGNSSKAAEIVEGKKFATTFLNPEEESEQKSTPKSVSRKSITEPAETEAISQKITEEENQMQSAATVNTESEPEIAEDSGEKEEPASASLVVDETMETEEIENEATELSESIKMATNSEHTAEVNEVEPEEGNEVEPEEGNEVEPEKIDKNESLQQSNSVSVESDGKENQIAIKKIPSQSKRNSLPDIVRLPKTATSKKTSRVSLGDLSTNRQDGKEASPQCNSPAVKDANETVIEPTVDEDMMNVTVSSNKEQSMGSNDSKDVPLDISSQEENNNQKSSAKKGKRASLAALVVSDEIIPQECQEAHHEGDAHDEEEPPSTLDAVTPSSGTTKNKKVKRKFDEMDITEAQELAQPKKMLRIVSSASGLFVEEPMTPEKRNKHGFKETPRTPINPHFKIEKNKKRKSFYLEEDEAKLLLPKPKWQINVQFNDDQPKSKRARKLDIGSSEVVVMSLQPKKKASSIPPELRQFRNKHIYRAGLQRQDARSLLRDKIKRRANIK